MVEHCLSLWVSLLYLRLCRSSAVEPVTNDTETTMTSTWLNGDWSFEKTPKEIAFEDRNSGCICRSKHDHHIVCYGATTCASFPGTLRLPSGMRDFRLKTTMIHKLSKGELSGFTQLARLDIDANFRLNEIEPGFFSGMVHLINVSVSFNTELRYLHKDTFHGLINVNRLRLIKNGFHSISDVTPALNPQILPRLATLSLSENVFRHVNETSFLALKGTKIRELDLILCQIERMHPKALKPFAKLEKLRIGENNPKEDELEELFRNMAEDRTPIKLLNLYELGLRKGPKLTSLLLAISKLKVKHLNLRRNHIENLYEGLFPEMPDLETLDLREASVVDIESKALNQNLMPKLETLLLGGNKLSGVVSGVLLPQLSDLDLSANSGTRSLPSYFDVNANIFQNMSRLISLNLSFNRIATITNTTFNGVHHLRILGLKNATIFYIAEHSFVMLHHLFLLNLENNPFTPFNTFPDLIFQGLARLEILLLSNCAISHFLRPDIFHSLESLRYLNLKGNNLIRIHVSLFAPLHSLTGLDLSSNQLTPWDYPKLFNQDLRILLVCQNRFTYLTHAMMDDFVGRSHLDISMNPFVCDATLHQTVRSWLFSRNLTLNETSLFDSSDVCLSPEEWRDQTLTTFLTAESSEKHNGPKNYIPVLITVFLLVLFIYGVIFYYRWHFRYWIFLLKMSYLNRENRFESRSSIPYKYDAFVSYSHEDRNFVARLVSMLENEEPYLKLCVYERDFEIGTVISETVMDKVNASRRIMFVVSNAFAKSQWCIWELQLAEYHRVFVRTGDRRGIDDLLIMIKLGPLKDCVVTPILRYMLRTRIYLEWSSDHKKQKIFWDKLRHCLVSNLKRGTDSDAAVVATLHKKTQVNPG